MKTIDKTARKSGQNHGVVIIEDHGGARVRITIDVDTSYREQSKIRSEVWTGAGWAEVVHLFATDPSLDRDYTAIKLADASTDVKHGHDVKYSAHDAFAKIADRLRRATLGVIR